MQSLEQVQKRLAELRENPSPPGGPFDWDDVEYLRLLSRKLELGRGTFNPQWFEEMADKLTGTLGRLDDLTTRQESFLQILGDEIREINRGNGWNVTKPEEWGDTYKIPGVLALIHSEVSEALEAFRKDDGENFVEELADILIRILDLAPAVTVDFDAVVRAKLEKNKGRGHKHGGKKL